MTQFAHSLKTWRRLRRLSQLDLAGEAEVSTRHLSFLETGRARPSREMIARLSQALGLPLDARNQLLTQAGFAARYPARQWDSAAMAPIRQAVAHMLDTHAPFPGLALDRLWTILRMNRGARALFARFGVAEGCSLLDLLMSDALPGVVENWPEVAHHAARRLRIESAAQGGVARLDAAVRHLAGVPGTDAAAPGPVVPTVLRAGDLRLSMFSTIAQFGTAEDVTLDDLKIELYFPTDAATAAGFAQLCASAPVAPDQSLPDR